MPAKTLGKNEEVKKYKAYDTSAPERKRVRRSSPAGEKAPVKRVERLMTTIGSTRTISFASGSPSPSA
jgi:hypothetical protein